MKRVAIVPASDVTQDEFRRVTEQVRDFVDEVIMVHNAVNELSAETRGLADLVINIPRVVGKSEAVFWGLKEVIRTCNAETVIQIDGHLKQPPEQLRGLVEDVERGGADLGIFDRYTSQDLTGQPHRRAVASFMAEMAARVTGLRVVDAVCGTRVYTSQLAERFLEIKFSGYALEKEQLAIAGQSNAVILQKSVSSNIQDNGTLAEKIEDNLEVLVGYGRTSRTQDRQTQYCLANLLTLVKARSSFTTSLGVEGLGGVLNWQYAYKAHGLKDVYSLAVEEQGS